MSRSHSFYCWKYPIVYVFHNFFIHSHIHRHLGCFCVLAIINNAAMNIGIHTPFQISVFRGVGYFLINTQKCSHVVYLLLVFEESIYFFPQGPQQFTVQPMVMHEDSLFSHILTYTVFVIMLCVDFLIIVLWFQLKSLIHFELIFVCGGRRWSGFIFLAYTCPIFPAPLAE